MSLIMKSAKNASSLFVPSIEINAPSFTTTAEEGAYDISQCFDSTIMEGIRSSQIVTSPIGGGTMPTGEFSDLNLSPSPGKAAYSMLFNCSMTVQTEKVFVKGRDLENDANAGVNGAQDGFSATVDLKPYYQKVH